MRKSIWNDFARRHSRSWRFRPSTPSCFAAFDAADEITKNAMVAECTQFAFSDQRQRRALPGDTRGALAGNHRKNPARTLWHDRNRNGAFQFAGGRTISGPRRPGAPHRRNQNRRDQRTTKASCGCADRRVFSRATSSANDATRESFAAERRRRRTVVHDRRHRSAETPSGVFKILGRTSIDILKSGGYKLSALEIEEVDSRARCRRRSGSDRPTRRRMGRPRRCVHRGQGRICDDSTFRAMKIRSFCKEKLAAYKVPEGRHSSIDALPRNAMGKVVKAGAREERWRSAWVRRRLT